MTRLRSALFALALLGPACQQQQSPEEDTARAKLAGDLVQCKNDLAAQKEKYAELQVELNKAKAAADRTVRVDGVELHAAPAASAAKPRLDGNIPPEQLSAVIKKNSPGLRSCYERALKRNPNLQYVSSVNVRFAVKNTGGASDVGFSPHTDRDMEGCMAQAIEKWKFPAFQGDDVQVEAPVSLIAR